MSKAATNERMSAEIAIIGAGSSGLAFARLLELNNVEYVVFEQNPASYEPVDQAPADILPNSGEIVIREAHLLEEFDALARREAQYSVAFDHHGDAISSTDDLMHPQIDRVDLHSLLLKSIPEKKIRWDSQIETVTRTSDNTMSVHLPDGRVEKGFKLVVGADGLHSKIRPLVTSASPRYFGITHVLTSISHEAPDFWSTVGGKIKPTNFISIGHGKILSAYKHVSGTYTVRAGLQVPENWKDADMSNQVVFREKLLRSEFRHWGSRVLNWLKLSDGEFHTYPLYYMPTDALSWTTVPGLTLLGDAAHPTPPYDSSGTSCSLYDSLQLAQQIVKHGLDDLDSAVSEYEKLMFPRAIDMITKAIEIGTVLFAKNAPEQLEALILGRLEERSMQRGEAIRT